MSRVITTFSVEEKPIPKPGLIPNGHGGVRYPRPAADHYRAFKGIIGAACRSRLPDDWEPIAGLPVLVRIVLEFKGPPKSRTGDFFHTAKPDLENAGSKPILDALTGIVWADDDQVAMVMQAKLWRADDHRVTVQVVALTDYDETHEWVRGALGWELP